MAQERIWNYGALLTQARMKALARALSQPGICAGFAPTVVGPSNIALSPGSLLMPSGLLVTESTTVYIDDVPTPSSAADYTLVARSTDPQSIGGATATYVWVSGIQPTVSGDDLAVLWLRHPGSTTLSLSLFASPPTVNPSAIFASTRDVFGTLDAPFAHAVDVTKGSNCTITPASVSSGRYCGASYANSALVGTQNVSFRLKAKTLGRPRSIAVYGTLPALGVLALSGGIDTAGNAVTLLPASVNGALTGLETPLLTALVGPAVAPLSSFLVTLTLPPNSVTAFLSKVVVQPD